MTTPPRFLPTPETRRFAQELADLRAQLDTVRSGLRATQLGHSTLHNGYIVVRDADGVIRQVIGRQDDGTFGQAAANGPPPPRPNTPDVVPIMAGLEVRWNGQLVDAMPRDFSHLLVYVSGAGENFIAGPSNLAGTLFRAGALPVAPLPYTQHWVRFVAVSTSGKESVASFTASGTPARILGSDLFPETITHTEIAPDSIDTPHLRANAVTALNIAAEAIQAGHIEAGAVTAAKFAATLLLASRVEMRDQAGNLTLILDGPSGDAVILGEYRTALTGARWVINPGNALFQNSIQAHVDGADTWMDISADVTNSRPSIFCFSNSGSGPLDGGAWGVSADEAMVGWLTEGGNRRPHHVRATATEAEMASPIVRLRASGTDTPATGQRRITLVHTDSSNAVIAQSVLEHVTVANQAHLRAPSQNVGIRYGIDLGSGQGRLFVRTADGNTARSIEASGFITASGRAGKRNIRKLQHPALDTVRAAPAREWQYHGEPARHVGPMAEDLPDTIARPGEDGPTVDLRDMIGTLWAAVDQLAERVDQLATRIA